MKNRVLIISAPSGSGKSTIVRHLIRKYPTLEFSITATTRSPRGSEQHGKEYYFFTKQEFESCVKRGDFIEWEEVYEGRHYGTLKSEIERIFEKGNHILFDVDVMGGINLKNIFKEDALSIFIKAPSVETLKERLIMRGTDSFEEIERRVAKAKIELECQDKFDVIIVNDELPVTIAEIDTIVSNFIYGK